MRYYSELTKELYETEADLVIAETKLNEEKARKEKLKEAKKTREEEVYKAMSECLEADKKFKKVLSEYCKDYGTYHFKKHGSEPGTFTSLIDLLF